MKWKKSWQSPPGRKLILGNVWPTTSFTSFSISLFLNSFILCLLFLPLSSLFCFLILMLFNIHILTEGVPYRGMMIWKVFHNSWIVKHLKGDDTFRSILVSYHNDASSFLFNLKCLHLRTIHTTKNPSMVCYPPNMLRPVMSRLQVTIHMFDFTITIVCDASTYTSLYSS